MNIETLFEKYINLRKKLDQAKIYKIVDNTDDKIYIGSTCKTLQRRLSDHKSDYNRFLKGLRRNITSFGIIKNNNYHIELLEKCNIKTKDELTSRERHFIEHNDCVNKNIPGRTDKEYKVANRDKIRESNKEYKVANRDKIRESNKEYRVANIDKINEKNKAYKENNKEHLKEQEKIYRVANKDKINEKNKAYKENNKDKIKEKAKTYYEANKNKLNEKFECPCGYQYTHNHKARHEKTKTHQKYLESI